MSNACHPRLKAKQINGEHHEDEQKSITLDPEEPMEAVGNCKPHITFSITDAIRKTKGLSKYSSDSNNNNNYKSDESSAANDHELPATDFSSFHDQNNNDSDLKNGHRNLSQSRNHQMQQLLQQHVFTPHQLQQLSAAPMTMSTPKDSLFHFEQKRKQMEILMHQIQEQLHANILQQTHLLQNQSPTGEGTGGAKKGNTFQLQQKLVMQQQELAQQFQLVQRQYLLHQSGMQLLFPHHQQQLQNLSHCNEYCSDDNSHKIHSADTKGHLFDASSSEFSGDKVNFKNDTNNNTSQGENALKEKEDFVSECEQRDGTPSTSENHVNGNRNESPKMKQIDLKPGESPSSCISQFLNSIINFRRDEMSLNLNNLLSGANQQSVSALQPSNLLLNDLNRSFLAGNFGADHMNPALASLVTSHQQYSKYGRGACKWPGCDMIFDDLQTFTKHLNTEHSMDDCTTAQARIQMQVVFQLEIQLQKEKDRLQAMMHHLHLTKESMAAAAAVANLEQRQNLVKNESNGKKLHDEPFNPQPLPTQPPQQQSPTSQALHQNSRIRSPLHNIGPIRRRITDKSAMSLSGFSKNAAYDKGLPYMLERAGLDVQQEIQRNREFYKNADVRPPFTYASLIRQSIIESPDKQLTLNEIYNWFQNTFCYFRRNAATWKVKKKLPGWENAIRTNLSLHKCFVRYEDDFGSFWMVDDNEFVKRRHLSRGRPRKYDPSPSPTGGDQSNATNQSSNSSQAPNAQNTNDQQQGHSEAVLGLTTFDSPANSTTSSINYGNEGETLGNSSASGVAQNLQSSPVMHSPSQNNIYGENMAINFQNFWLSPTNLLDDNSIPMTSHHIKSDKYRSQSLSPSRSPNGPQNYSNHESKMDVDMMSHPFNYEHSQRRKPRVSSRSSQRDTRERERYYQPRNGDPYEEAQAFQQNHQMKLEVASNYGDDDEKVEDEPAEDLRRKADD